MKTGLIKIIVLISLFVICATILSMAQVTRIADNNASRPTGANIYPTLQAAINASSNGDIVYVQPSPNNYGDIIIDRSITVRGVGFNTGKDIPLTSVVNNITFTNTLTNATNASGSVIEGLSVNFIYLGPQTGTFSFTFQNVTISNCAINQIARDNGYMPLTGLTIQNCSMNYIFFRDANVSQFLMYGNIFYGGFLFGYVLGGNGAFGNVGCCMTGGGTLSSAIFSNNVIYQSATNQFFNTTISALAITNNIFVGGTDKAGSRFISGRLTDATVSNNIFFGTTPGSNGSPFERNSFLNNLTFGTSNDVLPPAGSGVGNTGSGNLVSVDPKFVNAPYGAVYSSAWDLSLQAGSPGKNAGTDGTDIGITGGAYPVSNGNFALKAPHVPVIMTFNPAAIVPQGQPIKTNIKAKSN